MAWVSVDDIRDNLLVALVEGVEPFAPCLVDGPWRPTGGLAQDRQSSTSRGIDDHEPQGVDELLGRHLSRMPRSISEC